MVAAAKRKASYDDLYGIPEDAVGEIIDGELIVTPRPSSMHGFSAYALGGELLPPYQFGRGGGPGGWIIIGGSEIKFGDNFLVPDVAGWRKERFPQSEPTNWISVAPDWITEVLSPSTVQVDSEAYGSGLLLTFVAFMMFMVIKPAENAKQPNRCVTPQRIFDVIPEMV